MLQATSKIWMDGKLVPWEKAQVHFLTHALHYGSGVFEGIRAYKTISGKYAVFRLKEHVQRFFNSARVLELPLDYNEHEIYSAIIKTVRINQKYCRNSDSIYIRPLAFYGFGMGLDPRNVSTHVGIACWPWAGYFAKDGVHGIKAMSTYIRRMYSSPEIAHAKIAGHYSNSILAKHDVHKKGFDEAVMYDAEGNVAEGTGENIFIVKNKKLITPPRGNILLGITRDSIMEIARDLGFPVFEKFFRKKQLYAADEAFYTGTAAEIAPIRQVDGKRMGDGRRGQVTEELQKTYFDAAHGKIEKYSKWLDYV